jgi:glycerol-3-phosphate cytidylyltransferase
MNKGRTVGFTCGAMDLFHAGHVSMMEYCKLHCDYLIVGLQTDPSIDRSEKNAPVQSLIERYVQLKGCSYVDQIIPYQTESELVELLTVYSQIIDVRFVGDDWRGKNFTGHDLNIRNHYNPRFHNYSSSELRERVCDALQNTKQASEKEK